LAEVRAGSRSQGDPVLVRALFYPDRRTQLAAAEALIRIPNPKGVPAVTRVVDVLRRTVLADIEAKSGPKVLVGFFDDAMAQEVSQSVEKAGFEAIRVRTGREALKRLDQAADIDILLFEAGLPDPGPASLLGQLRADVNVGLMPLILAAPQDRIEK